MLKIEEMYEKHEHKMLVSLMWINVAKLLLQIVLLAHVVACCWFNLALQADPRTECSWAAARFNTESVGCLDDSWKANVSLSIKYQASLYWAIATMATAGPRARHGS